MTSDKIHQQERQFIWGMCASCYSEGRTPIYRDRECPIHYPTLLTRKGAKAR